MGNIDREWLEKLARAEAKWKQAVASTPMPPLDWSILERATPRGWYGPEWRQSE